MIVKCSNEKKEIAFISFEKIVLDFFLSKHENFLMKVREIFRSLDYDDDGILSRSELVNSLGYLDPINTNTYTYGPSILLLEIFTYIHKTP